MDERRRILLKGAGGALALFLAAGALRPVAAYANPWNRAAFEAAEIGAALAALGAQEMRHAADHAGIVLRVPAFPDNGAVVPIEVVSHIPGTNAIAVLVHENFHPLAARFEFAAGAVPAVALRAMLMESSVVQAVVEADGRFYTVRRQATITTTECEHH